MRNASKYGINDGAQLQVTGTTNHLKIYVNTYIIKRTGAEWHHMLLPSQVSLDVAHDTASIRRLDGNIQTLSIN